MNIKTLICCLPLVIISTFTFVELAFSQQDYVAGEGDVLRITVYDHPDLKTIERVSGEGVIHFPLIGEVKVENLTVSKISEKISKLLADGYIVDPQVSVFVEEFRSKKTVIMGQVQKPGLYVLHGQITFIELLSKTGGLTKDAGETAIIKRKAGQNGNRENRIIVNLRKLIEDGDVSQDVPIMDGDNIYVTKAGVFYVSGEVSKPDAYKYEEGLTVVKAITMAGGFTDIASAGRIKIIRKVKGSETVMEKVDMNEPVLPDDVIIVPESLF